MAAWNDATSCARQPPRPPCPYSPQPPQKLPRPGSTTPRARGSRSRSCPTRNISSTPTAPTPTRYLLEQRAEANIAFLTHLGDVTEHGTDDEISLASECFRRIDGKLPYSVLAGNHDVNSSTDDQRGSTAYLKAFGPARFAGQPTFLGSSADGYNSAHLLTAGGRQWLVLALDWRISDGGLS